MKMCNKCILPENYNGIIIDENGECNFCKETKLKQEDSSITCFSNEEELIKCLEKYKSHNNKYDVLVPLSGGVDSSNALIKIVEQFKLKPLVYHNDHGYEDEIATNNVKKLCKELNVDLIIMQHDFSFMKKLWKYMNEANVPGLSTCYVCGNILYLNSIELADKLNIKLIINGYSKGQAAIVNNQAAGIDFLEQQIEVIRETADKEFIYEFMNKHKVLEKKITYSSKKDLEKDVDPEKIMIIPFYIFNFYKTDKDAMKELLMKRFDWQPMKTSYPKRTTNCEMVWLNTYMDYQKSGYSMYHTEYSELIRRGELTKEQAISDLKFEPQHDLITRLAREIDVDIDIFKRKNNFALNTEKTNEIEVEFEL